MLRRVIYAALERKLNRAYRDRLAALGPAPNGVYWNNESTQIARFDALLDLVATVTPVANPMIGDVDSLRKKFANTKTIASGEQSGTASASEATLLTLKEANQAYLDKHGFIFIICATGLSADAMLNALQTRLPNSTDEEIRTAAQEQIKITLLRIDKALTAKDEN